ncbi:MAG TPA: hypothetical protein VGB18_06730 [Candidatus Thermoplasmatota archaeon]
MTDNASTSAAPQPPAAEAPKWIYEEVIPAIGSRVRSLHLLKQKGGRRSVLLFSEEAAMVAEKGRMGGVKVYRVDYPKGLLLNESNCPHCGKMIQEPVGKVAHLAKGKKAPAAETPAAEPEDSEKKSDPLAYARDMKTLRARAKAQPGGKGPIKNRPAAQKLRKKHGLK